ncbi:MAG: phosphoglucomutase/phosphomannomutase family protein [Acidobacteria bacterium]|nr:phosphoglucomutase/phosphomannomutase family protein [Acidobacteriota bacterium]
MMTLPIKFGTDGWRGIIADTFTFENVRHAAQATADYLQTVQGPERAVFIGYDVRFLSKKFAQITAEVFRGNGFRVVLMDRPYPTPYVSFEVKRRGFVGGIVITASHNPPVFNGFKVKAHFGGSATPSITAQIESRLGKTPPKVSAEGIETAGPGKHYFDHLRSLVDWDRIAKSSLKVVVDSMHGSGGTILESMLRDTSVTVKTIRGNPDPLFGGINPEPMLPQLEPLVDEVRNTGSHIGLATDGDADRLGIIDETGEYVDTLRTLSLLLLHVYRNKGWRGAVARTYSQSQLVPRIASSFGLQLYERPIGFKNIGELMLENEILIGGEESGGIGLSRHLPERDGIFINLLMLDLLAVTGKTCTELIREMWKEFGEFHYDRRDLHVPIQAGEAVVESWRSNPLAAFAGRKVQEVGKLDGSKVFLENDSWILFRQSGTEPLLRVYCEAPSRRAVEEIMSAGLKFVEQFTPSGVH